MNDIWLIYSTFPNKKEAVFAARRLLEKKLIACANIHDDVTSLYHWQGALRQEMESILLAKTTRGLLQSAMDALKQWHPYELPCIVAYAMGAGFPPFLQWVAEEVTT